MEGLDRRELLERAGKLALAVGVLGGASAWAEEAGTGPSDRRLRELIREIHGDVVTPASHAYARGRLLFDTRFDGLYPKAIVYCESTEDVRRTVAWARRSGVRIVPRCGGHSYGGYSSSNGVVVDVTRMNRIRTSGTGRAVIGAGALLIDVYAQLAKRAATIPAGSCPSVGIAGLTLGGGASYAGRKLGLTCDSLLGLTIVTARGKVLTCSGSEHPDLYWACRGGGGGNFGIVTSFHFRTHPVQSVAYYAIAWPWQDAADVVRAWQDFAPHAPDELFSTLYMTTTPMKGAGTSPAITSGGQFFGTEQELQALIAPLASTGSPKSVKLGTLGYMDAVRRWAACHGSLAQCHRSDKSPGGTLTRLTFKGKSDYVDAALSTPAIAVLLAGLESNQRDPKLGRAELIFDPYGGAINRVPAAATAFVHRKSLFSIQYFALWERTSAASRNLGWIRGLHAAMRPYVSGFAYQNYIDPDLGPWRHAYYGSNLKRLVAVKKKYDGGNFFRFAQSIPPQLKAN